MSQRAKIIAWFPAWAIPGLLLPGFVMLLPIGALITPPVIFLVVALLVALHRPRGPEIMGVLLGLGIWGFAIAYFNRNSNPCPESGSVTSGSATTQFGETFSCGGVAPEPFLLGGVILIVVALLGAGIWTRLLESSTKRREAAFAEPQ